MRLIDADAVIEKTFCTDVNGRPRMVVFLDDIKSAPTTNRLTVSAELKADWLKRQYEIALSEIERLKADRPTVIRSRMLMPTKDFMEWAKRVKEVNPNVIVIPCDAEVPYVNRPKGKWIEHQDANPMMNIFKTVECSACGHIEMTQHNYCPECGADMRGESDE